MFKIFFSTWFLTGLIGMLIFAYDDGKLTLSALVFIAGGYVLLFLALYKKYKDPILWERSTEKTTTSSPFKSQDAPREVQTVPPEWNFTGMICSHCNVPLFRCDCCEQYFHIVNGAWCSNQSHICDMCHKEECYQDE